MSQIQPTPVIPASTDAQRQRGQHRINNVAQVVQLKIERMFMRGFDGIYRGEVRGLHDSTRAMMQTIGLRQFAEQLMAPMMEMNWRPEPAGLIAVEKENGGHRFLAPPSDFDRIRQRAIYNVIGPRLAHLFSKNSFGFISGRGSQNAVLELAKGLRRLDLDTLILADIIRCFPSLLVARVLQEFKLFIGDKILLRWIDEYLRNRPPHKLIGRVERRLRNAGTLIDKDLISLHALQQRSVGVPEGSALSPLACSLYLRPIIAQIERLLGDAVLVHYADNLAIVCKREHRQLFCDLLVEAGQQLGLTLGEPEVISRQAGGLGEFLGYSVGWLNATASLTVGPKAALRLTARLREVATSDSTSQDFHSAFNERIVPILAYYRHADPEQLISICGNGLPEYPNVDREWALARVKALLSRWSKPVQATEYTSIEWSDAALSCAGDGQHAGDQEPSMDELSGSVSGNARALTLAPLAVSRACRN